jgi:hypothetical protein
MPVLTGASRRRAAACWRLVGVALLLAVAGCTAERPEPAGRAAAPAGDSPTAPPIAPRLLAGVPLTGPTGLELLVSSNPPRLLDIDAGTSRMVAGVPGGHDRVAWVQPVGRDGVIVSQAVTADGQVFRLRRGAATATPVGRAADIVTSRDGRGLWLWRYRGGRHCSLREVGLDGRQRRPARRVDCDTQPVADTDLGLLVRTEGPRPDEPLTALVDPDDGHRLASYPVVHAVAGDLVIWGGEELDQGSFTLTDRRTGDGRLLLLGSFDRVGDALAQRRPGQDQLAVRRLRLPADRAGSDSFVPRPRPPR